MVLGGGNEHDQLSNNDEMSNNFGYNQTRTQIVQEFGIPPKMKRSYVSGKANPSLGAPWYAMKLLLAAHPPIFSIATKTTYNNKLLYHREWKHQDSLWPHARSDADRFSPISTCIPRSPSHHRKPALAPQASERRLPLTRTMYPNIDLRASRDSEGSHELTRQASQAPTPAPIRARAL